MNNYLCSIFCSFYKGEKFIEGYIKDILKQTLFNNIEFIFLDCNSPENEKQYILPLTEKYANIKYYKLEYDPGLYAGWNRAIQLCSSEIIGNWNIDDRKPPTSIESLYNFINADESIDMVYGKNYISYIANETYEENNKQHIYPCYNHSISQLLRHNSPHCMPLWRKRIHNKLGFFDEKYKTVSDAAMWLWLSVSGGIIKMIDEPLGLYYWNPNGQSTNPINKELNQFEIMQLKQNIINFIHQNQLNKYLHNE